MPKVTLGYWGFRGRGHTPRLLLAYTGADWEDKVYTDKEVWAKDKKEAGIIFANLPYIAEGDFKIAETKAVVRYIINRSDKKELLGKDAKEQAVVDALLSLQDEIAQSFYTIIFAKADKKEVTEKIEGNLKLIQDFIATRGKGTEFAIGYLTVVDFSLSEFGLYFEKLLPEVYKKYTFFEQARKTIDALPAVQKYYAGEKAVKGPLLPPGLGIE